MFWSGSSGALGLRLGQRRTGCETETNSELGHHCICVRTRSADEKLEDKRWEGGAQCSTQSPNSTYAKEMALQKAE